MSSVALKPAAEADASFLPLSAESARLAEQIARAGQFLLETRTLSTRGKGPFNAAVRVPGRDRFVLGDLDRAVLVGFDGGVLEGRIDASLREVIAVYTAIFTERPDLDAALHTHSPHLTAYAIAHRPFPIHYWSLAKRAGVDAIPLAEWAPRYSPEPVLDALRRHPDAPATLLKNRGLFAWGRDGIERLAQLLFNLDEGAEITLWSEVLGGARPLPEHALSNFLQARKAAA